MPLTGGGTGGPCGPVAHPLFQLCGPGPPTFCVPFLFCFLFFACHHRGRACRRTTPTCIKYKCWKNLKSEKKKCVGVPPNRSAALTPLIPHPPPLGRSLLVLAPCLKILATPVDKTCYISILFYPSLRYLPSDFLVLPDWLLMAHITPPQVRWWIWYFPQPWSEKNTPPPLDPPLYGNWLRRCSCTKHLLSLLRSVMELFAQPLPGRIKLCLRTLPPPPPTPTPPTQLSEKLINTTIGDGIILLSLCLGELSCVCVRCTPPPPPTPALPPLYPAEWKVNKHNETKKRKKFRRKERKVHGTRTTNPPIPSQELNQNGVDNSNSYKGKCCIWQRKGSGVQKRLLLELWGTMVGSLRCPQCSGALGQQCTTVRAVQFSNSAVAITTISITLLVELTLLKNERFLQKIKHSVVVIWHRSILHIFFYKLLKKSPAIQLWALISFLLLFYDSLIWYHWKVIYSPLHRYPICNGYVMLECTVLPNTGQSQRWKVANEWPLSIASVESKVSIE